MAVDFPTFADLFAVARRHILQRATRITPEQVDVEGTDVNIIGASAARVGYEVIKQLIQKVNTLLLDGAVDDDLDRYAFDRYQLPRKGAANAVSPIRFFRNATGLAGSVPVGQKVFSLTGIEYVTTTEAVFSASDAEQPAQVRAIKAGKEQQVGANAIRRIDNPSGLFDPDLQVTNDVKAAGGEPRESNEVFRERIRDFWIAARRGTKGAIEFGAKQAEGVESSQAQEVLTPDAQPARVVVLHVADGSGVSNTVLGARSLLELEEFRAAGIAVVPSNSVPQIVDIVLKLTFLAGTDTADLTEKIRAAVVSYMSTLPVNATLYRQSLATVLSRFVRDGYVPSEDSIVEPTGDLVPVLGKTLRTTSANVTTV
jgi:hypothetical protein